MRFSPAETMILENQIAILTALQNMTIGGVSRRCGERIGVTVAAVHESKERDEFGRMPAVPFVDLRTRKNSDPNFDPYDSEGGRVMSDIERDAKKAKKESES